MTPMAGTMLELWRRREAEPGLDSHEAMRGPLEVTGPVYRRGWEGTRPTTDWLGINGMTGQVQRVTITGDLGRPASVVPAMMIGGIARDAATVPVPDRQVGAPEMEPPGRTIDDVVAMAAGHARAVDGTPEQVAGLCTEIRAEFAALGPGTIESAEVDQDVLAPRRPGYRATSTLRVEFRPAGAAQATTYEKLFAFAKDRPRTWRDRPAQP
jgi:hypothetical protein